MASYQALYRKWRPLTFDTVVGQEHVTRTLKNEIRMDRIAHAYLFCGSRGTGKTSTARILSRAVNCEHPIEGNPCNECPTCKGILDGSILDVLEIDAASNNGVDNIRSIREEAQYSAATAPYRIYIIDEVHMLSSGAFNALLKLLEEPPEHVIFILATTEAQKVPATILSRCQRFDFHRIGAGAIRERLIEICEKSGISYEEDALSLIAKEADGAMRDALSIMDQCLSVGNGSLPYGEIAAFLGATDHRFLTALLEAASQSQVPAALALIDEFMAAGKDPRLLMENLIDTLRSLLVCKSMPYPEYVLNVSVDYAAELKKLSECFSVENILHAMTRLSEGMDAARFISNPRVILEMTVTKICLPVFSSDTEALAARLGELERKVKSGAYTAETEVSPTPKEEAPPKEAAENTPSPKENEAPSKEIPVPKAPLSERLKTVKEAWPDICRQVISHKGSDLMLQIFLIQAGLWAVDDQVTVVTDPIAKETIAACLPLIEESIREVTDLSETVKVITHDRLKKNAHEVDHLVELIESGNPIVEG